MAAAAVASTTGLMGMWNGTKDGREEDEAEGRGACIGGLGSSLRIALSDMLWTAV